MTKCKTCYNCKFYRYDNSVGASDCDRADDIPEDLFEMHFIEDLPGCPFWDELEDVDYTFENAEG